MRQILVAVLLVLPLAPASAQEVPGPRKGTWGAEGAFGSASVLRFRSPASAWVMSVGGSYVHQRHESSFSSDTRDVYSGSLSVGHRRYRNVQGATRPFTTLSAMLGSAHGDTPSWQAGASFEAGAAHFFTPHVSLGASGQLRAVYLSAHVDDPRFASSTRAFEIGFFGFRLLGAVYF